MSTRVVQTAGLRGRASECTALDQLVEDVRRGESRSLVLKGEAGIGKTALLTYVIRSASDMTVLRAVGVQSEMELPYASLHQLCAPVLDRIHGLPAPQREALRVVFGLAEGTAPDRFLAGVGVLSLLSDAAERHPVLCVIDDAQWLDQASALTLAFVARRLLAERVGIVFAAREPGEELEHLSVLQVAGLANGDARALLGTVVGFVLDKPVGDRIIKETHGNPLALLELPRGLTATELAGGFGLLESRGLSGRIEESFLRRIALLPDDARRLLLVAAAEPVGDPLLLWGAAERLGIAADAGATGGLLAIEERVVFHHPLVRSAVYESASVEDRRAAHRALADVTSRELDPDRRAWHLATAAVGPDEEVAAELERSAGRAQARGGVAAAAAFLRRSVALTRNPERRAERCLAAAQAHLHAGAFDAALQLLASAEAGPLDELGRARVDLLRGQIAFASTGGGEESALMLLEAARRLESLDLALARETYLDAWGAAMLAGQRAPAGALDGVSRAGATAPQPTSAPTPADLLLDGLSALVTEGRAAAPKLSRAVTVFAEEGSIATAEGLRWGWFAGVAASTLWDESTWHLVVDRQLRSAREAGVLSDLPFYLQQVALTATWRGDFAAAGSLLAEADAITEATGTHFGNAAAIVLACFRGREADASPLIELEARNAAAAGHGLMTQMLQWASGTLRNGLGRYDEAVEELKRASEPGPELGVTAWVLPELIEAASRTETIRLAGETLERLRRAATAGGDTDWGIGILARSSALLSEGQDAEDSYREAIERLAHTRLRPELARAHLVYGEWLRRESRRVEARDQLRMAHELFVTIGMEAFAERARSELQATGEHVRRHTVEARDDLTAQERQIAELARDGLSNPEIGARLFLSPRTVEWHLRHVFAKLGIHSRRELADALPSISAETVPV